MKVEAQPQKDQREYFRRHATEQSLSNILNDLDRLENGEPARFAHTMDLSAFIATHVEAGQQASAPVVERINATASADASSSEPHTVSNPAASPIPMHKMYHRRSSDAIASATANSATAVHATAPADAATATAPADASGNNRSSRSSAPSRSSGTNATGSSGNSCLLYTSPSPRD